jgi:CDP-diacylglycerol--serine O-phosphatidyltransferase
MVSAILLFVLVASQPKLLGFLILLGYLASGLIYTLFVLSRRSARMLRGSSQDIS